MKTKKAHIYFSKYYKKGIKIHSKLVVWAIKKSCLSSPIYSEIQLMGNTIMFSFGFINEHAMACSGS